MRFLTSLLLIAALSLSASAQASAARNTSPQPASGQQEKTPQQQPGYSISVTVPVVNVDVVATDDDGNYVTGLKKENFRILEDGQRQTISNFDTTEAPMTTVMLVEYSKLGSEWFLENAKNWGRAFLRHLKPTDWVALTSFSMRPKVEVDFTHSQPEIEQALAAMIYPSFSESNLFDALGDTLERLNHVKGKKSILILASGLDTFSRTNLDDVLDQLRQSDVTVYVVGVAEQLFMAEEMRGGSQLDRALDLLPGPRPAALLRGTNRRAGLVSQVRRRDSGDYGRHRRTSPQPVQPGLCSGQQEHGREIPQDQSRVAGHRRQTADERRRSEREEEKSSGVRAPRLSGGKK